MTFSFLMSHSSENFGCYLVLCHHTDEIGIILNDSGGQTRKYQTSELINEGRRHKLPERVPQARVLVRASRVWYFLYAQLRSLLLALFNKFFAQARGKQNCHF